MNWDRLSRVTAPAVKPLTLDAAKAHLRVDSSDQNATIQEKIDAAIASVDGPRGIGICMISQQWRLTLDGFRDRAFFDLCDGAYGYAYRGRRGDLRNIPIPLGPVISVDEVAYTALDGTDQVLVAGTDYKFSAGIDPAIIFPPFGTFWPIAIPEPASVRIKFTAGFGPAASDVPGDLIGALELVVGHLFANREDVVGTAARVSPVELPKGAGTVFDRYRCGLFG